MPDTTSKLLSKFAGALGPEAEERCGLIGPRGGVIEVKNIHHAPQNGFHMDPEEFMAGIALGAVATWHTHPAKDPNLSEEDMQGFVQWPDLEHHIVGIRDGQPAVQTFKVVNGIVVTV